MIRRATAAWECRFRYFCHDLTTKTTRYPTHCSTRQFFACSSINVRAGLRQEVKNDNFYHRHNSVLRFHRRDLSLGASSRASTGRKKKRPLRSYQNKAKTFLEQITANRVQPGLVTQKVEELLLLFLSEFNNNLPSDGPMALELLNTALRYAERFPNETNGGDRLSPRLFSLACQIILRSGHYRAFSDVHQQLLRLLDGHNQFFVAKDRDYNTHHVNDVCSFYVRHVVMDANKQKRKLGYRKTQQLHQLLDRLGELHRDPSVPIEANPYVDDSMIMLLCNQLKPSEAHEILRKRVEISTTAPSQGSPLLSSFVTLINGYAKTFQPDEALRIVEWMILAQTEANNDGSSSVMPSPNVHCFNGLLHAYAMAGKKDAGFKAEKTLEWMEQVSETHNLDTIPNETTYNICINAWARSKHRDAPTRAESILRDLVALGEAGGQVEPSDEAFTAVMNSWVNNISNHGASRKKVEEATNRVAGILDLMERISENNERISMSVIPYTVLIKAWEKTAQQSRGVYKQKCADEILGVVERIRARDIAPTTDLYNSILTGLAETSAINAVFYFLELEQEYCRGQIQLDTRTFNCGLNAIAALNRPDGVDRATDILKRMFEYHKTDPTILPSNLTFNIILKVLSKSTSHIPDAAAKADDLLSEMDAMPSVTPDFISYVTCIIAWGRSNETDKLKKVTNLLHRFVSSTRDNNNNDGTNSRSGIAVFNAVLSVCHHNSSEEHCLEGMNLAKVAMQELRKAKGISPDRITYESFFQVMDGGNPMEDNSISFPFQGLIEREFKQCTRDGFVTREIVEAVHRVAPEDVFATLVGEGVDPRTVSIPRAWCRNVTTR